MDITLDIWSLGSWSAAALLLQHVMQIIQQRDFEVQRVYAVLLPRQLPWGRGVHHIHLPRLHRRSADAVPQVQSSATLVRTLLVCCGHLCHVNSGAVDRSLISRQPRVKTLTFHSGCLQ